ncbi:hypothetical protein [Otariodibacter sp.]|uniref:hypothetical protein n=1 Tax=Otariodibacter sp. TaxID=3030919 RepID=UPI0026385772|nr:hypothetical protein [Otariodibacter sp.]
MQKKLENLYTSPSKQTYKIINFVNNKFIYIVSIIILTTIILSTLNYVRLKNILYREVDIQNKYKKNIRNKLIILSKAHKRNQEKKGKNNNISIIDSKIKEIIIENGGELSNLQWYFDNGQKINVLSTQNTKKSISIIEDINKIKSIMYTQIILSKTDINKSIELDITLTIIP